MKDEVVVKVNIEKATMQPPALNKAKLGTGA